MSYTSSPRRPPSSGAVSSKSWTEWTQQLQAYVAWVNSQLRKKPGTKEVKDLRRELQDGTVLIELIEIVANESIPGTHTNPTSSMEMKENIDRVLQFMRSRKIKMHQIRSSDIIEGNMKSIMRLILALAAHFKPSSVKQSSHQTVRASRSLDIAQEAATALANIRKDAEIIKKKMHRPAGLESRSVDDLSSVGSAFLPPTNRKLSYDTGVAASSQSPPTSVRSISSKSSHDSTASDEADRYTAVMDEVHQSQNALLDETRATHNLLVELQSVLLTGADDSLLSNESLSADDAEGSPHHEQLVLYQARLQQADEASTKLREELNKTKQECMQLQAMKQGLHQRLSEQQQEILQMKAKALRDDMKGEQHTEEEMESLREELTTKTTMLNRMHGDLERGEKTIEHLKRELLAKTSHTNEIIKSLEQQVKQLEAELESSNQHTAQQLTNKITPSVTGRLESMAITDSTLSSDVERAESALGSLRSSNPGSEAQVAIIESAFSSLLARLKDSTKTNRPTAEVKGHRVAQRRPVSHSESTKLLCFTTKSVTPSMKTVHKRLGDVTLGDFRSAFSPQSTGGDGNTARYLFKTLDPEFGTVKEELTDDRDVLPGWEGKVIGWIEED